MMSIHINKEQTGDSTSSTDKAMLLLPHLRGYEGASNLAFNELVNKRREAGEEIHHLAFGQSPFPVMAKAQEALCENAGQTAYLQVAGLLKLREAVCRFHKKSNDLSHFSANDIIVGPGTKELIFLLLNVFNGDVLLLSPSWTTYRSQVYFAQRKVHIISTNIENGWKLTPQLLENFLQNNAIHQNRILILCNPDNPTGTSYTSSELESLSSAFREHNILVLADEIYAGLHFENSHKSLAKFYPEGTIISSGISKWASAGGWRLGFHMYPNELAMLRKTVASTASQTYSCAPAPIQYAAVWMYSNDTETREYMAHTQRILAAVASYCHRKLVATGVKAVAPTAGFYMFPDFEIIRDALKSKGIETCPQMCDHLLNEEGIALMSGGPAFLRPETELTVRLCFIDFDGAKALEESTRMGLNRPLDDKFVAQHCSSMYTAINKLAKWVEDTKKLIITN
ncbi:putative aspartate aminotransferase [Apostichopus japonicus]|uniref:Putative aspartate aminotransferase n=1 Tax=Stichopus japonicus TaxID=307972 RepID=A0A2G8L5J1_STIJA|nr:putative aspartate aminotransferase [Apostichopus japonicus]